MVDACLACKHDGSFFFASSISGFLVVKQNSLTLSLNSVFCRRKSVSTRQLVAMAADSLVLRFFSRASPVQHMTSRSIAEPRVRILSQHDLTLYISWHALKSEKAFFFLDLRLLRLSISMCNKNMWRIEYTPLCCQKGSYCSVAESAKENPFKFVIVFPFLSVDRYINLGRTESRIAIFRYNEDN